MGADTARVPYREAVHREQQQMRPCELVIALFHRVLSQGGVVHLWGHSREVEERGTWSRLARALGAVARPPALVHATRAVAAVTTGTPGSSTGTPRREHGWT